MDTLTPVEPSRTCKVSELTKCCCLIQEIVLFISITIELLIIVRFLWLCDFDIVCVVHLMAYYSGSTHLGPFLFLAYIAASLSLLYGILKKKTCCFIPYIVLVGPIIILAIFWCIEQYGRLKRPSYFGILCTAIGLIVMWLFSWLSAIFIYRDFKRVTTLTEVGSNMTCDVLKQVDV